MLINEVARSKISLRVFFFFCGGNKKKTKNIQKVYQFELQVKLLAGRAQNNDIATLTNRVLEILAENKLKIKVNFFWHSL